MSVTTRLIPPSDDDGRYAVAVSITAPGEAPWDAGVTVLDARDPFEAASEAAAYGQAVARHLSDGAGSTC